MTSHDVRQMHECTICGGIGFYRVRECPSDSLLVAVSPLRDDVRSAYAHPRCYVRSRGIKSLLCLPDDELSRVRLCDVSKGTMSAIMRRRDR
jgi:hypothetical protein